MKIEIIRGPEGSCVSLNDYRVAGPKPWGGGKVVQSWPVAPEDIRHALGDDDRQEVLKEGRDYESDRIRKELSALAESWRKMPGTLEGEGYRFAMADRLCAALDRICPKRMLAKVEGQ